MATAISTNRTVTTKEAKRNIIRCIKLKRPLMMWGPPGIGKSEVVADICKSLGGKMYDMRLPLLEPTDLRGMPYYNKDINKMDWAAPIDLPDADTAAQYPIVVLFLDELNGAAPSVQAAAYQLILNRKIGKYELPDNVVIVAAGNRESDKGVTYRMPAPLANRFIHLELRVDFDSWNEWAVSNKQHHDVVGYLNFAKNDLFDFDPKSPNRSFATPRSWSFVSQLLEDDAPDNELVDLIAGSVGEGMAIKFMAHRKVAAKMPRPSDILNGTVTTLDTKEISAMYSLVTSMCYELKDAQTKYTGKDVAKWHVMSDFFLKFMMDNFITEVVVLGASTALTVFNLPLSPGELTHFDEFYKKFGKYILNAKA